MAYIPGHTKYYGHCYRLCPFSQSYKDKYYLLGFDGNSTYGSLPVPDAQITTHTYTEGTMVNAFKGSWGFRCDDDACYFFITYGRRYFES